MDLKFPAAVDAYLLQHKGEGQAVEYLKQEQVRRAIKRVNSIGPLVERFKPKSVLDIGCGLGTIPTILALKYSLRVVHLMDGDANQEKRNDFRVNMQPWNSVHAAAELARLNLPDTVQVIPHVANPDLTIDIDMIMSFKSWGVHYPISTYLPLAQRSLKSGGLLLIDIKESVAGPSEQITNAGFKLAHWFNRTSPTWKNSRFVWAFERV